MDGIIQCTTDADKYHTKQCFFNGGHHDHGYGQATQYYDLEALDIQCGIARCFYTIPM